MVAKEKSQLSGLVNSGLTFGGTMIGLLGIGFLMHADIQNVTWSMIMGNLLGLIGISLLIYSMLRGRGQGGFGKANTGLKIVLILFLLAFYYLTNTTWFF